MKDLFSEHAGSYQKFRPSYPPELFQYLSTLVACHELAWDCGTGNGQIAASIAPYFRSVYATDLSEQQLLHATTLPNIRYQKESAEQCSLPDRSADLIIVGQAVHWFDFDAFYRQVNRVSKPGGLLALIGYGLLRIDARTDEVIDRFYREIVGPYWDKERHYLDDAYATIPFPYREFEAPPWEYRTAWSLEQLTGYLNTWSAVKHYEQSTGRNPVLLIRQQLENAWKGNIKEVCFPLCTRIGSV